MLYLRRALDELAKKQVIYLVQDPDELSQGGTCLRMGALMTVSLEHAREKSEPSLENRLKSCNQIHAHAFAEEHVVRIASAMIPERCCGVAMTFQY